MIDSLLVALLCRGHALMVGVPGLGKTLMAKTLAVTGYGVRRIQFTPDLMPSDITGTDIIMEDHETGRRKLEFVRGPLFANFLLADEINRAPPKTQAAFLQAMQELEVSVGRNTYTLPPPFFVVATQNPVEQERTYPLPEAQLDRFMFNVPVLYPSPQSTDCEEHDFQCDHGDAADLNRGRLLGLKRSSGAYQLPTMWSIMLSL